MSAAELDLITFPLETGDRVTVHTNRHTGTPGRICKVNRITDMYWVKPDREGGAIIGPLSGKDISLRGLHG